MIQQPNKKSLFFLAVILMIIALVIVVLAQNKTLTSTVTPQNYSRDNNIAFEAKGMIPAIAPMNEDGTFNAEMSPQPSPNINSTDSDAKAPITTKDFNNTIQKKVIKTGNIDMRVNSVEDAINEIRMIAQSNGGDEVSSDVSKTTNQRTGYILVKIPVDQYNEIFTTIKNVALLITHESSQAQDVTAQFIDLESRIKNKKEHETQLRTFFDKANDVDELIQIERELARVRTEIEQMDGQLTYLQDQTQFSTIYITLREDQNIVTSESWQPLQVVKDSFSTFISRSTNLINSTLRFIIASLPFIILFGLIGWFLYWTAKHIFKK